MARRRPSAYRRSGSSRAGSSRTSAASRTSRTPRARADGKIDIQCPQCGAGYRVKEEMLDEKIEWRRIGT